MKQVYRLFLLYYKTNVDYHTRPHVKSFYMGFFFMHRNKKPSKTKLLQLWSKEVRERDQNKCCICGRKEHLNAHHILEKKLFPEYALCLENGITLCAKHHSFSHLSAHRNAVFFCNWLKHHRHNQYQWVLTKMVEWKKKRL